LPNTAKFIYPFLPNTTKFVLPFLPNTAKFSSQIPQQNAAKCEAAEHTTTLQVLNAEQLFVLPPTPYIKYP
ncbi:hypothetical protein, partial [Leyella stercorea]|jgi:hypothetical protein|uniref:hypothetical protein n=1 Tax=Leyella stercorea TaxID=363265 RepID=UPI00242BC5B7